MAYRIDDPMVVELGRFLQSAPLSNGVTTTGLSSPMTEYLAQAVLNWSIGVVWDDGWIEKRAFEKTPDLGEIEIEELADGAVVKMRHRATGVHALGESHDEAWIELKRKVRNGEPGSD